MSDEKKSSPAPTPGAPSGPPSPAATPGTTAAPSSPSRVPTVPASAKGRATVQVGDAEPVECQTFWVPDPGAGDLSVEDREILDRLRPAAAS